MEHKKKYHGGYLAFFLLCFVFFFGNISNSFARTTLTDDEAEYIFNYLFNTTYDANNCFNLSNLNGSTIYKHSLYQDGLSSFKSFFNASNDLDIDPNSTIFWARIYGGYDGTIYYTNFNNGKISNLPHLYIKFDSNDNTHLDFFALDDNKNIVLDYPIRAISFNSYTDSLVFSNFRSTYLSSNANNFYYFWRFRPNDWNSTYLNGNNSILENISGVVSFSNTNAIYTNFDGVNIFNQPVTKLLHSEFIYAQPPEPEPETPSGDSGLGNITTSSGENGGNINLQPIQEGLTNIQNQISGDSQRIIDSQNENTQIIVNTISGEVSKITNTLTESADNMIDNTTISSGDIVGSLGFNLMENPYQNFWFEMTQGLSSCLTGSVRSIPVNWLGYNGYFNLDGLINYPTEIKTILTSVSTVCMVWLLVKWWKIIIDKLTSGDMDEVLAMNEEERYC